MWHFDLACISAISNDPEWPSLSFHLSQIIWLQFLVQHNLQHLTISINDYCYHVTVIITRRRSWSFAEYCKHFVARLNDVHAFGYNSAGSERIWMKFGVLRVYCLELSLTHFGQDPRRSGTGSASRNFVVFCPLNNARFYRLPVGQISRNFTKVAQKDVFPGPHVGLWKTFVKICP